jgi:putative Mn2+ efflux pump MntP
MAGFIIESVLLGAGLSMDAFSISLSNGLRQPGMRRRKAFFIAGTFAWFQFLMPMIGWICVHTIAEAFAGFQKIIPWIAFFLLTWIGGKMLLEAWRDKDSDAEAGDEVTVSSVGARELIVQGLATSMDALSVGFTIADYGLLKAFVCSLIIGGVTLVLCLAGVEAGKRFGLLLKRGSAVFGGVILVGIGIRILVGGLL